MNGLEEIVWRDIGDSRSIMYVPSGEVVAEMVYGGRGGWSIKVLHKARGVWIDRDLAKAAAERIFDRERPGRIWMLMQLTAEPAPKRGWMDVLRGFFR